MLTYPLPIQTHLNPLELSKLRNGKTRERLSGADVFASQLMFCGGKSRQVRILPGALALPQLINAFRDSRLRVGLTPGGCLVGEPITRSGTHWSPTASLAAASRRTATSSRSVGKSPA